MEQRDAFPPLCYVGVAHGDRVPGPQGEVLDSTPRLHVRRSRPGAVRDDHLHGDVLTVHVLVHVIMHDQRHEARVPVQVLRLHEH